MSLATNKQTVMMQNVASAIFTFKISPAKANKKWNEAISDKRRKVSVSIVRPTAVDAARAAIAQW